MPTLLSNHVECHHCGRFRMWDKGFYQCWYCHEKGPALEPVPPRADNQPLAPRRQPVNGREQLLNEMAEAN